VLTSLLQPLSDRRYRQIEYLSPLLGLAGLLGWVLCWQFKSPVGIVTSMAFVWLMALMGCYIKRREEKGIWMLALLMGGSGALFYVFFLAMSIRDWVQGQAAPGPLVSADFALAAIPLIISIRASWTALIQNREFSRNASK
jgi:hypothetical protein